MSKLLQELGKQLLEAKTRINQLEKEKAEMLQLQTQQVTVNKSELEAMIERMVTEKVQQALANLPVASQPENQTSGKPSTRATAKPQESIDWEGKSNAEL